MYLDFDSVIIALNVNLPIDHSFKLRPVQTSFNSLMFYIAKNRLGISDNTTLKTYKSYGRWYLEISQGDKFLKTDCDFIKNVDDATEFLHEVITHHIKRFNDVEQLPPRKVKSIGSTVGGFINSVSSTAM